MTFSLIKPRLTNLSGSAGHLGGAIVERDLERPGTAPEASGGAVDRSPRHVLVLPMGPPRQLAWTMGGAAQRETFASGDAILNPVGLDTNPQWAGETELVLFAAAPEMLDRAAQQIGRSASAELVPRYHFQDVLLHRLALTLSEEFEHEHAPDLLYAESLTHALVAHLLKRYTVEGAAPLTIGRGLSALALQRVTDYMGDHLAATLTLAEMARVAGYSPSHFTDLFRRSTGRTPHQYVIEQRLDEAERLLANTSLPIATVALQAGFADQSHLTRTMRRRRGVTPGVLREA